MLPASFPIYVNFLHAYFFWEIMLNVVTEMDLTIFDSPLKDYDWYTDVRCYAYTANWFHSIVWNRLVSSLITAEC